MKALPSCHGLRFTVYGFHRDAALAGAEGDAGFGRDDRAGREAQAPAARERGEDEHGLHPREALADAAALAAAEGEVGELRPRRLCLRREALGVEALGLRPEARVAVHHVLADEDERAARDEVAADLVVFEREPAQGPSR